MGSTLYAQCEVTLKGEDESGALQVLDRTDLIAVRYEGLVRGAHVLGTDRVDAKDLRWGRGRDTMGTLRELLLGPPLNERDGEGGSGMVETDVALTRHILGLDPVMKEAYGEGSEAQDQARVEVCDVARMSAGGPQVCCKRAALLFALHREPELKQHFAQQDEQHTRDLTERVLPFIDPKFLQHSCQAPEAYVLMAVVLSEMWGGEKLGNWPRTTTLPVGS